MYFKDYVIVGYEFKNGAWKQCRNTVLSTRREAKEKWTNDDYKLLELWTNDDSGMNLVQFQRKNTWISCNHRFDDKLYLVTLLAGGQPWPMYRLSIETALAAAKIETYAGNKVTYSVIQEWDKSTLNYKLMKVRDATQEETKNMSFQVVWTTDKGVQTRSAPFENLQYAIQVATAGMDTNEEFVYINMGVMNDDGMFVNIAKRKWEERLEFVKVPVSSLKDYEFIVYWYYDEDVRHHTSYKDYETAIKKLREWPHKQANFGWINAVDDLGNKKLIAVRGYNSDLIIYRDMSSKAPEPVVLEATNKIRIKKTTRDELLNLVTDKMSDVFGNSDMGFQMGKKDREQLHKLMNIVEELADDDDQ